MCTVSAVYPQIAPYIMPGQGWPSPNPWTPAPASQPWQPVKDQTVPFGPVTVDRDLARQIKEVLERLDKIDKALGLKDCSAAEPEKKALMERLDELSK